MNECICVVGLCVLVYFYSMLVDEVFVWVCVQGMLLFVVKLVCSVGVIGVKICWMFVQVEVVVCDVLVICLLYNQLNDDIVIQSYFEGQEYIVDLVLFEGCYCVVSLWEVYCDCMYVLWFDKMLVLNYVDLCYVLLFDYVVDVFDVLDVCFGLIYLELFDMVDGLMIVELNVWLYGSFDLWLMSVVSGENYVLVVVEVVLYLEWLFGEVIVLMDFCGYCGYVLLLLLCNGVLWQDFMWQVIQVLLLFVGFKQWIKVGDMLCVIIDLQIVFGMVGLYSLIFEWLFEDCWWICEIEVDFFVDECVVVLVQGWIVLCQCVSSVFVCWLSIVCNVLSLGSVGVLLGVMRQVVMLLRLLNVCVCSFLCVMCLVVICFGRIVMFILVVMQLRIVLNVLNDDIDLIVMLCVFSQCFVIV